MGKYDKGRKAGGLKHCRLEAKEWDLLIELDAVLGVRLLVSLTRLLSFILIEFTELSLCYAAHLSSEHTTPSSSHPGH